MARIQWHQAGSSIYESGLDRVVLYVGTNPGVPWNGVVGITEDDATEVEPLYFNATKYNDILTLSDFAGSIVAYTYPDEFLACQGILENEDSIYVTGQAKSRFNLAYRTLIGEDGKDLTAGYKIHLLYNLTAIEETRTYKTLVLESELQSFTWKLTGIPENISGFRPTSHLIIDSRKINQYLLADIEDVLYGLNTEDAKLPTMKSLLTFIRKWDRIIIEDNLDGTWTIESDALGVITLVDSTTYTIDSPDIVVIDANSYTISSSNKNEEDI